MKSALPVRDFFEVYKKEDRPYCILGMGPTFAERNKFDLSKYATVGINRIVTKMRVNLCQIIDFYIAQKYEKEILANCDYLVVPYYPHFACRAIPGIDVPLLIQSLPFMAQLNDEGRLLCFNLSTIMTRIGNSPVVKARYFSAEASFNLLGHLGVKDIVTLGIDGGTTRAEDFKDHGPCDPRGFNLQWDGIKKSIERFSINYHPLVESEHHQLLLDKK